MSLWPSIAGGLLGGLAALGVAARFPFARRRSPPVVLHITVGKEPDMPVSASIAAFVTALQTRVPAAIQAAVAADRVAQEPAIQARIDEAVKAATAEVVQDDTDGAAALKDALDTVAPVAGG